MLELLPLLNQAITQTLRYDLAAQQKLQSMEGRSLCWNIQGFSAVIVFKVLDGVLIIDDKMQSCQVTVDASPKELFELWQHHDEDVSINLQMTGNPLSLQDFSQLFKSLNIEWQAILEDCFGDLNAQIAGRIITKTGSKVVRTLSRIKQDIQAYQRDEMNS